MLYDSCPVQIGRENDLCLFAATKASDCRLAASKSAEDSWPWPICDNAVSEGVLGVFGAQARTSQVSQACLEQVAHGAATVPAGLLQEALQP